MKFNSKICLFIILAGFLSCGCVSLEYIPRPPEPPDPPKYIEALSKHIEGSFATTDPNTKIRWLYLREVDIWVPVNYNRSEVRDERHEVRFPKMQGEQTK